MTSDNINVHDRTAYTAISARHHSQYGNIENANHGSKPPRLLFSKRCNVTALLFVGYVLLTIGARMQGIVIIDMTYLSGNNTTVDVARYDWDSPTISLVLNMFWYGFLFSPFSGHISQKFGASVTLGGSMLLCGVLLFVNPFGLQVHFYLFLLIRGLIGFLLGITMSSITGVIANWIPKAERAKLMGFIVNGIHLGNVLAFAFCGFLTQHFGWPMSFYGTGAISVIWAIIFLIFVTNDPSQDKWISQKELAYLQSTIARAPNKNNRSPYKAIFLSPPFWALFLCKFAYAWTNVLVVSYCPLYINDVIRADINLVGYIASIPSFAIIFILPVTGILMDHCQKRTKIEDTKAYKIIICNGFVMSSALYILVAYVDNFIVSIVCFVLINVIISYNRVIYEVLTVNIAPNHSSLISGLTLFGQTIGIIVAQSTIGYIVQNHKASEWDKCFCCAAAVLTLTAVIFGLFGSSKPQPWSVSPPAQIVQYQTSSKPQYLK
ncbi:vesicular glutamate transporter 2.2-like [Planococcus citri]|uniref:vesicular glutamate transporter 2.2-like n=1 Tax=Planococcus citri TaxID=170843 RepID=UPI0031F93653